MRSLFSPRVCWGDWIWGFSHFIWLPVICNFAPFNPCSSYATSMTKDDTIFWLNVSWRFYILGCNPAIIDLVTWEETSPKTRVAWCKWQNFVYSHILCLVSPFPNLLQVNPFCNESCDILQSLWIMTFHNPILRTVLMSVCNHDSSFVWIQQFIMKAFLLKMVKSLILHMRTIPFSLLSLERELWSRHGTSHWEPWRSNLLSVLQNLLELMI